jgi:carboxymethylenebutenolidase
MERVKATLDALLAHPNAQGDRAGIVALSFGGWYGSGVASERADVAAFVSIYSDVYEGPGGAAYLGHFAEDDQFVESPEAAGAKPLPDGSAAHIYPGMKHWFTESDRPEYDEDAAELVYSRTVAFLLANLT